MTPENALLPLCIALTVLGLVLTVVLALRGNRGRALQAFGLALAPVGLYLTGLLRMLWDAVVALGRWGQSLILNPTIWAGFGLIALSIVLWLAGAAWAGRIKTRRAVERAQGGGAVAKGASPRQVPAGRGRGDSAGTRGGAKQPAPAGNKTGPKTGKGADDSEMDEIEAILKSRGIE